MTRQILRGAMLATLALLVAAGPSFAQAQGQGQGRQSRRGGRGTTGLLFMPEVQKELNLDPAQVDLLQGLRQQGGNRQSFQELRNLSPEERQKRFTELRQQQDKKIAEILNAKQVSRLKQLVLQREGYRALGQKEVADQLKLSAGQQQQVQTALQGEREAMQQAFAGFRGQGANGQRPSQEQRQQAFQKLQETRTATDAKLAGILTDAQKKQFEQMQGAKFAFPQRQPGQGRRRGNNAA